MTLALRHGSAVPALRSRAFPPSILLLSPFSLDERIPVMSPDQASTQSYETTDLTLASFLRCRSFVINDIRRLNGRTVFVFDDTPPLRSAVLEYANDAPISVRSFCSTMRDLKAITR